MTFSILFWNVWYINQTESNDNLDRLLNELKNLDDRYQPDCIALNEVVQPSQDELPPVIAYLQKLGYKHTHYATMTHIADYWMSGVVLVSKFKMEDKQRYIISKNGSAARYGYPGMDKEVISAAISLPNGPTLNIIVVHPGATIDSVKQHRVGMRSLERLVRSEPFTRNTLLLGDMNEWRWMPGAFRTKVSNVMHSRTGSLLHPTWRYNAHQFAPLRLNLDYVYWSKQSDFRIKDFELLTNAVSDHRPILATFEHTPLGRS